MNDDTIDQDLLDRLSQASNRQLHMLHGAIGRLLADPRRFLPIRRDLYLGQSVEFLDWERGQTLKGQVIAMHDRLVELAEHGGRHRWKLPYTAIVSTDQPDAQSAEPKAAPPPRATREQFRRGDRVAFEDRYLQTVVGTIVRINQRTATVDPGDGTTWRVGFALLRPVVDV